MRIGRVALAGALALAACGSGNQWGTSSPGAGGGDGGGPGGDPCKDGVTLRLAGIDPGTVTSLVLTVGSVTAKFEAGGSIAVTGLASAPIGIGDEVHDLAVLGLAGLPTQWGHAIVTLSFSSGSAFLGDVGGALDMCTAPLTLHVDPGLVKPETCEAIVKLDVGRSVAAGPDGLAFLPQFRVVYH